MEVGVLASGESFALALRLADAVLSADSCSKCGPFLANVQRMCNETWRRRSSRIGEIVCFLRERVARPERVELPTFWFVARRSIQLSYGRAVVSPSTIPRCDAMLQLRSPDFVSHVSQLSPAPKRYPSEARSRVLRFRTTLRGIFRS
jgi:hypothetical protein